MKKAIIHFFTIVSLVTGSILFLSWGTWGHQHINHAAVFALPDSMRHFFYNHIDYITEESVIADVRKYTLPDKAEFSRHYIDIENYQVNPTDSLPLTMKAAMAKYDAKFLDNNGTLPWTIMDVQERLTKAFKDKKKAEILFLSAYLGHYLGDATQPLHTSANHDGQLTGQNGIHSFFESQLPEQFGGSYNFYTGDAVYINDVQAEVWRIVLESHKLVDTLLLAEKKLKVGFDTSKIYARDAAGRIQKNKYNQSFHSYEYAKAYHEALNGMIEKQMRMAVSASANFWYTAWINAGRPDLNALDQPQLTERNSKNYKKDYKTWQKGKLFGFKIDAEF